MPSGFGWRWSFALNWRGATLIFGGAGLLMLGVAARQEYKLHTELATWPRLRARVDSAAVATPARPHEDVYAARLWLGYAVDGREYTTPVTDNFYSSGYGRAVRTAEIAKRAGATTVLANPNDPRDLKLNPGYNLGFFSGELILGALGLWFCGFGVLFGVLWRLQGGDHIASTWWSAPSWVVVPFLVFMGILFAGGGLIGMYFVERQRTSWSPVLARVDSTDVVRQSSGGGRGDLYAPRLWLTYAVAGLEYHAPLVAGAYWSNYDGVARKATAAKLAATLHILVDPNDHYAVTSEPRGAAGTLWLPGIFLVIGLVLFGVAAIVRRSTSRRRAARRT